jgi:hypothetical protein
LKRVLIAFALMLCACPHKVDVTPLTTEAASLQQSENDLLGRRGLLQRERSQISDARKELSERRAQLGHDSAGQAALDEEDKKLIEREGNLSKQATDLDQKVDELIKKHDELVQRATQTVQGASGADPLEHAAKREQSVAEREKGIAHREADVAERERTLADREKAEAKREKDTCSTQVVVAPAKVELPKGLKYSAHDVEPIYRKALKIMQERGILPADLPAGADKLVGETRDAMKAADYVRAKYSADQLLATVEAIKIDRNFISVKMARLATAMRGKKLEGDSRHNVEGLFQDATANYGDGRFTDANGKINKLFAMLK